MVRLAVSVVWLEDVSVSEFAGSVSCGSGKPLVFGLVVVLIEVSFATLVEALLQRRDPVSLDMLVELYCSRDLVDQRVQPALLRLPSSFVYGLLQLPLRERLDGSKVFISLIL